MIFPDCTVHDVDQRSDDWFNLRKGRLTGSKFGPWLADSPKVRLTVAELRKELTAEGVIFEKTAKRDELVALLSHPDNFMTESDKTISSRMTAIYRALGDLSGCPKTPEFEVDASGPPPRSASAFPIWRGMVLEPYAREEFERLTGMNIDEVGFCSWNWGKVSVSPDGQIQGKNQGWETKAPDPHTHAKYLLDGVMPDEYEAQVHGSMAATGAESWWFMSYCPRWHWREDLKQVEILQGGPPPFIIEVKRSELTERYLDGLYRFQKELEKADQEMAKIYSKPAFEKVEDREESLV